MGFGKGTELFHPSDDCFASGFDALRHLCFVKLDEGGLVERNPPFLLVVFHRCLLYTFSPVDAIVLSTFWNVRHRTDNPRRLEVLRGNLRANTGNGLAKTVNYLCWCSKSVRCPCPLKVFAVAESPKSELVRLRK